MLTTNYYNMKFNNRLYTSRVGGSISVTQKINSSKQFRYPNGDFSTGISNYHYGGGDVLFGAMPDDVIYRETGQSVSQNLTIGFDGSNTPASIDDYKLINPIHNCSIIAVSYSISGNTIIRDFTIKNNNNAEIIINGVGLVGSFTYITSNTKNLVLLYREVFASPITIPAGSSFIYRLETTEGE